MAAPSDRRARWIAPAALAVAVLSILLNAALLWRLRDPGRLAAPMVQRTLDRLSRSDATIKYQVRIPAGTPLHFDVPFEETYRVRVNTSLPIDTRINVPIRGPLGTYNASVPIKANVPIRAELPVRLRDTFQIRTQTQSEYVVPLEIRIRDLPLDALKASLNP